MNSSRRTRDGRPSARRPSRSELLTRSDEQLVELVLDGQDAAFETLFDRHVADSLWYARDVLGSWGEAEDAVRHSFAAAHAYLATRGRETEFRPWLKTILGNYCLSMLQSRPPGPEQSADDGNVVDLGDWRLRRKLFGTALPVASGAGLRDSVMAACGIGAGATTAGMPLLGGMLAKLAVVAVLAGGAGAVGDRAPEPRAVAADTGTQATVEQTVDTAGGSRAGADPARESTTSGVYDSSRATVRELDGALRGRRDGFARDRVPAEPSPVESSPATGNGPAGLPAPAVDSATADARVAVPPPVRSTLRRVVDVVKARVPGAGDLSSARLPGSVDLSKIGDDLGVAPSKSPVDVRALLSRGTAVLPK